MYRTCIFCSSALGANEALEAFPVGRTVAFDAAAGRLWAVCPRCSRWNLAPLEERWEPVEDAERHFRDARLRVQSENVGLAKLRDGTRLVRVGAALPGELAAWRYGAQLRIRRTRYWAATGAVAVGAAAYAGLGIAGLLGGSAGLVGVFVNAYNAHRAKKAVYRLGAADSPTGAELLLKRHQLNRARLNDAGDGGVALLLPEGLPAEAVRDHAGRKQVIPPRSFVLRGDAARAVLARAMVTVNRKGAGARSVDDAVTRIAEAGGPEALLRLPEVRDRPLDVPYLADGSAPRVRGAWTASGGLLLHGAKAARQERKQRLDAVTSLAVEMALHEESERHALQGELAGLEAAWREAEEIAAIADSLFAPALPRKG